MRSRSSITGWQVWPLLQISNLSYNIPQYAVYLYIIDTVDSYWLNFILAIERDLGNSI